MSVTALRSLKTLALQALTGLALMAALPAEAQSLDPSGAVIFAYQRVGEDLYPDDNISKEQFAENIHELIEGGYTILPLPRIVAALRDKARLPDRTVAITFDGAYRSALENAIPLLLDNNIPFTVFFSPDQADSNTPQYMGWSDIRRLRKNDIVTLGLHTAAYTRLNDQDTAEIRQQVNKATARFREMLKDSPAFFAYPFGEYSKAYRDVITASGFTAAFGQQSGVAYDGSDLFAIPRFAITESYGDDDRFRMTASSLPLPVSDITPDDPVIGAENPPTFGFTVDGGQAKKLAQLSCFISEQGKPDMTIVGENRVELRAKKPFESDRIRVNCTMPGPAPKPGEDQRWRWFGMLLTQHQTPSSLEDLAAPASGPLPN